MVEHQDETGTTAAAGQTREGDDVGLRFVRALAAKDTGALMDLLADDVDFHGLTPGRTWEARGSRSVVQDVLWRWFEPTDDIEEVLQLHSADVAGRARVDYRLRVRNGEGQHLVEQRAYFDLDAEGRVVRLEAFCGGFRSWAATAVSDGV